jgi:hypothetical protein
MLTLALVCAPFTAYAANITFDFDTGAPALIASQLLPVDQTVSGLTASFSPAGGFSLQNDGTTGFTFSVFSGLYLNPGSLLPGPLDIGFSQPLTSISFVFATANFHEVEVPSTIQLTAFSDASKTTIIGSNTGHGTYGGDTMPTGLLSFSSQTPFSFVEISIPTGQTTADFLVDDITVTTARVPSIVPEPASYVLIGIAFLAVPLLRRYC